MPVREARLLFEWADLYPGITPGVWYVAADLVPIVLRYRLRGRQSWEFSERILIEGHFEFRGGRPREPGARLATRVEDG